MIAIDADALRSISLAAKRSYPLECCGLLIGRSAAGGAMVIHRVAHSENMAADRREQRFEIDPRLRLQTMRALRAGPDTIVGHYHSHPDRPAFPSGTDIEMAFEPDLIWLIAAVSAGRAVETAAFRIVDARVSRLKLVVRTSGALNGETGL